MTVLIPGYQGFLGRLFLNKSLEAGLDLDLRDFWARVEDFKADGDLRSAGKDLEWGLSTRAGYWILNTLPFLDSLALTKGS